MKSFRFSVNESRKNFNEATLLSPCFFARNWSVKFPAFRLVIIPIFSNNDLIRSQLSVSYNILLCHERWLSFGFIIRLFFNFITKTKVFSRSENFTRSNHLCYVLDIFCSFEIVIIALNYYETKNITWCFLSNASLSIRISRPVLWQNFRLKLSGAKVVILNIFS